MGWKIKIERVGPARDREARQLVEEAARLRLRLAAARFDLQHTLGALGSHPWILAAIGLSAGLALACSPRLRSGLLKSSLQAIKGLLEAGDGLAATLAAFTAATAPSDAAPEPPGA